MPDIHSLSALETAGRLNISPATLQRWCDEFSNFLSVMADESGAAEDRRYTEVDLVVLEQVKSQLDHGLDYEQVKLHLTETPLTDLPQTQIISIEDVSVTAINYLSETIDELHEGQLSILNSQAANRELMGVLIQDNFNLKEENNRLRERMLDLERQIGTSRREDTARQEAVRQEFETKLMEVRQMATRNPITVLQSRSGCLGNLFGGGGGVQTIASPQSSPSVETAPPPQRPFPKPPAPPE